MYKYYDGNLTNIINKLFALIKLPQSQNSFV